MNDFFRHLILCGFAVKLGFIHETGSIFAENLNFYYPEFINWSGRYRYKPRSGGTIIKDVKTKEEEHPPCDQDTV